MTVVPAVGSRGSRQLPLASAFPLLSLASLLAVSATSRAYKKAVREFIIQQLLGVVPRDLPAMLKRAAATGGQQQAGQQHKQALAWLATNVPARQHSKLQVHQCLAIANAPAFLAQEMVAAGLVKLKLGQLVDAAGRRGDGGVPGLEVWVQAYQQLGLSSGLPALAVAICTSKLDEVGKRLPQLPARDVDDMLILAVNLQKPAVAEAMLDYMDPRKPGISAQQQQHAAAMQQRLTPRLVKGLLETAVARRHTAVLKRLCKTPAAAALTACDVAKLLRSAVTVQHYAALSPLFRLRKEQQMWTDERTAFAGVLRTAIQQHNNKALRLLCQQQLVQAFGALTVGGLVQCALREKNGDAVPVLVGLPGAQGIHQAYLSLLLQESVKGGWHEAVQVLSELPGAMTELEMLVPAAGSMYGVLFSAIQQGRKQMVYHLSLSPSVQELHPDSIAALIEEAVRLRRGVMVRYLFWIDPAKHISAGNLARLLEAAIRSQDSCAVSCMCELDCMQQLEPVLVSGLLQLAVELGDPASVCSLCQLRSAQHVAACAVAELLQLCMQQESSAGVLCALCQLPAAKLINGVSMCGLIKAAGDRADPVLQQELHSLFAQAGQLNGHAAAAGVA